MQRVDDRGGFRRQTGEVLAYGHSANVGLGGNEGLDRDGRRDLAGADQAARGLVDGPMDLFEEVLRLEEIRNPVKRVVVDQNGAEKTPFRFDVVRRGAV